MFTLRIYDFLHWADVIPELDGMYEKLVKNSKKKILIS